MTISLRTFPTIFSGTDIAMVNQETILGGAEHGLFRVSTFNSPQELGDAEVAAGVDVSISATNHALDRGFAGITWALEYWRTKHPEILVPGIADTQDKADEIPMLERNGVKVAILNYTESTNGIPIPSDAPFCVKTLGEADFASDMTRAREAGAEFIVVCPHWGTEYVYKPTEEQIRWASELVEAGADVIIGTHPHVLEPVEVLDGPDGRQVPVFWSLGNYISWQAEKPRMVGGMAKVTLERRGGECRVVDYSLTPLGEPSGAEPCHERVPLGGLHRGARRPKRSAQHARMQQLHRCLLPRARGPDSR